MYAEGSSAPGEHRGRGRRADAPLDGTFLQGCKGVIHCDDLGHGLKMVAQGVLEALHIGLLQAWMGLEILQGIRCGDAPSRLWVHHIAQNKLGKAAVDLLQKPGHARHSHVLWLIVHFG